MQKQVDKAHYGFRKYVDKRRWASMWHQLDEVLALTPKSVLEIGPGPGIFKAICQIYGVHVDTLDLDQELNPDYVASADQTPFDDDTYDVVCAFQMLEHTPYKQSLAIFHEMARIARKYIVISLPDARAGWPYSLHIPMVGEFKFVIPLPKKIYSVQKFGGEHYWEINKLGYSLSKIKRDLEETGSVIMLKTYRVAEKPYHRFFIFKIN